MDKALWNGLLWHCLLQLGSKFLIKWFLKGILPSFKSPIKTTHPLIPINDTTAFPLTLVVILG